MKANDVRVFHLLEQHHLVIHHLFVSSDILLEYDFDSVSLSITFSLAHDAIRSGPQCSAKPVLGPGNP